MADEKRPEPIANTGAFRAFSAGRDDGGDGRPARNRPSPVVFVTAIVILVALVLGVLAAVL